MKDGWHWALGTLQSRYDVDGTWESQGEPGRTRGTERRAHGEYARRSILGTLGEW